MQCQHFLLFIKWQVTVINNYKMRICFELMCNVWKSTIFQGQKPTLLPFLSSEEHIKEGQIRSDTAFKLQIFFDFVLVTYSFPINVLPPALNDYWTISMWWKGPFIFLQIFLLYFFFFFKWKYVHNTDDYILSGDHLMLQSKEKAVSTSS